jgi:hypothetical protein
MRFGDAKSMIEGISTVSCVVGGNEKAPPDPVRRGVLV